MIFNFSNSASGRMERRTLDLEVDRVLTTADIHHGEARRSLAKALRSKAKALTV
jgi:hypothetical protein